MRRTSHAPAILVALVALVCLVAAAAPVSAARAGEAAPRAARPWRLSTLTLQFADSFLGVPRTRLNDDNGFVADLRAIAELSDGERRSVRLVASQQLITERGGPRRVDDGKVYLEWSRAPASRRGLTVGWLAGLDLVGNLGGSRMQNWAHERVVTGRLLDATGPRRLQDRYPGRTEVLGIVGGHARTVHPLSGPWSLRGGIEIAAGAGTGFFAEVHPFVAIGISYGFADLELRGAAGSYWTTIRALTIPGGYVTRLLQLQPSARLVLSGPSWLPVILGFEVDWNSGNSSQHVGAVVLGVRF